LTWLAFLPTLAVGVLILFVPGLVVAALLRMRGLRLWAAAPALSVSLIAVAAVGAPLVGVPWSIVPVLALTVVAAVAAYAWARWAGAPVTVPRLPAPRRWITVMAVAVPAVLISFVLVRSIGAPEYFAQRYDNFFHLNAVRYVLDTGNASALWVGTMTSEGGLPFYPSAWHAVVSLIVMLSGASVAAATNAAIFVVGALVWPLGAVLLARAVLGSNRVAAVAAGVVAAALPAFPYLPLHYGVLYPLFIGLACLPVALSAAIRALRPGRVARRQDAVLLLILAVPGVAIGHPGALLALLALSLPAVVALVVDRVARARATAPRVAWTAGLVAYLIVGLGILRVIRPPADQIYWPPIESLPQAIGEVVAAGVYHYPVATVVAVLMAIGAYSAVRRPNRERWIALGMAVVGGVLYAVVAGAPWESVRLWLTGPWYNNAPRLASIWAVAIIPLAALGAVALARWILRRSRTLRGWALRRPVAVIAVFTVLLAFLSQGAAVRQAAADIEYTHKLRADGPILTPDEYALIQRLPDLVPEDAVIAGDPYTGASFAYGLSGRRVLAPHLLMDVTSDAALLDTSFAEDGDSPRVCRALETTGVRYILDFSADGDFMDNDADYSGLEDLDGSPFVELVAEEGEARLYRITSCGLGS